MHNTNKGNIEIADTFLNNERKIDKALLFAGNYDFIDGETSYEDVRKRPLAATVLGVNNTGIPLPDDIEYYNIWTDSDAQEMYLKLKPMCYLILGKQGQGCYGIAEALSKKLNCIHLCPKNIILDEIEQNSPTGKCLDFNMRHSNVCKINIIMSILKRKLQSAAIKHRGYIISGFPLITSNRRKECKIDSLNSEEALYYAYDLLNDVITNLKRRKPKPKTSSQSSSTFEQLPFEEEEEDEVEEEQQHVEEEEERIELPKFLLDSCSNLIVSTKTCYQTLKSVLLMQINQLLDLKPDIVVYVSIPHKDTVIKRRRKFINYMTSTNTFNSFAIKSDHDLRWPKEYFLSDYKQPYNSHIFNPKYNCKQPMNFNNNVVDQICNFNEHVSSFLEEKLKEFNPKSVIKIDGRMPVHQMIHHTMQRIFLIAKNPVLLPEPLYLEEPPDSNEDFWHLVEDLNVIRYGNVNFNRYASLWFNRCPVELKKRRTVHGNPKYSVTFFKHAYLLSSLEDMKAFYRNPRPYLKLKYLEPICRIIIVGTKLSGKTLVSHCLSWIFDCPVICYKQFLNAQRQNKYLSYSKTILSEIIATIEDKRLAKWEHAESERLYQLDLWFQAVKKKLTSYVLLLKKDMAQAEEQQNEEIISKYKNIQSQLMFLPILDDINQCEEALNNNNLLKYAPYHLTREISKPSIPVIGDEDVTKEISEYIFANELQNEIEPTVEEIMTEVIKTIQDLDSESLITAGVYGKYILDGFPSIPEYWEYLNESKLLPDYTIAIYENREIDNEIFKHYENIEKSFKQYHERYVLATDILFKTKQLHKKNIDTTLLDIKIILDELICSIFSDFLNSTEDEKDNTELINMFTEDIEKFRENWDSVKAKLNENLKSNIEIEIEDKSDIQIIDEALLKIRQGYCKPSLLNENEEIDIDENDIDAPIDLLIHNDSRNLNETHIYCPVAYYDHGILWKGKPEFSVKCDNKNYFFCNEESSEKFLHDKTMYQSYNVPKKKIPPVRICIMGGAGSGKTSIAQKLAKELGLLHVDFMEYINNFLLPRHIKKVGWHHENYFTDDNIDKEEEFQVDEENVNLSDILANEQELRHMLSNYFEHGMPLLPVLVHKLIQKLWCQTPFQNIGIVIDGFPKLSSDVQDMVSAFCIPDLIIELEADSQTAVERLSPKYFKIWKIQLQEEKTKAAVKLQIEKNEWLNVIEKKVVVKLIIDDLLSNIIPDNEEIVNNVSVQSTVFDADPDGSPNVDVNLFNTYNSFIEDYPEPVDTNVWEKSDDALERINTRLENIFETDDENIQNLKESLSDHRIEVITVDGKKSLNTVFRKILSQTSYLRNRSESFFEQTYIISNDIAEMLLLEGFFLLSKFNRMCPVFIYENPHAVLNSYNVSKYQNQLYSVIHRACIYFISSEQNVAKFRVNPLKYVESNAIKEYRPYNLRISIIGPPKSGKSKLTAKLARQYGLLCISKGMALRYILDNLYWTELGTKLNNKLRCGESVDSELIMEAVLTVLMDNRTMTNGYIFDGFPETPYEATELLRDGLFPIIIFDLDSTLETSIRNSQCEIYYNILKSTPPYSNPFIKQRYLNWQRISQRIRDWVYYDTQNLYVINGNSSKWQCYTDARKVIDSIIPKIHDYLVHSNETIVSVNVFGISNEAFSKRMSVYRNICPMCLQNNIYRRNDFPPDKKGLVQYKSKFYWICQEHFNYVYSHPEILSLENVEIPELPAVIRHVNVSLVIENGICLVTYAENLPFQKILSGKNEFAASYKGKIYLFCSNECLEKFLAKPYMYYNVTVFKEMHMFPKLSLDQLPHLGYLEQTLGNMMTKACCAVNFARPKYPGLDVKTSSLIHIALYLKTHNPRIDKSARHLYSKVFKTFEVRAKLVLDIGLRLRSVDNPFNIYPKCYNKTGHYSKSQGIVSSTSTNSEIYKKHHN